MNHSNSQAMKPYIDIVEKTNVDAMKLVDEELQKQLRTLKRFWHSDKLQHTRSVVAVFPRMPAFSFEKIKYSLFYSLPFTKTKNSVDFFLYLLRRTFDTVSFDFRNTLS